MKSRGYVSFLVLFSLLNLTGCKKEDDAEPVVPPDPAVINFGTHDFGSVEDIEGNTYKTIVIGSATWMAENLRTSKTNAGVSLEKYADGDSWKALTSPAYFSYNDVATNVNLYGYVYNEYAKDDVCPTGWHLPSSDEWIELADVLGGISVAGGKMKEEGTVHWSSPNRAATNSSGFTAMPGGSIHQGNLADVRTDGYWWSMELGRFYYNSSGNENLRSKNTALPHEGLAIRCVKD